MFLKICITFYRVLGIKQMVYGIYYFCPKITPNLPNIWIYLSTTLPPKKTSFIFFMGLAFLQPNQHFSKPSKMETFWRSQASPTKSPTNSLHKSWLQHLAIYIKNGKTYNQQKSNMTIFQRQTLQNKKSMKCTLIWCLSTKPSKPMATSLFASHTYLPVDNNISWWCTTTIVTKNWWKFWSLAMGLK